MSEVPEYVLERIFDAPRDLVWRTWTDPKLLHRWYGPNIETVIHEIDLRPGGCWLNEMKMRGMSDFSKAVFQEVTEPEKLVWHHSSSDSNWNIISNPMMPNWPRTLLTTVTFEDMSDKTNVHLRQLPIDATDAELACFAEMMAGMTGGWGSGYMIIDELLVEMAAENR